MDRGWNHHPPFRVRRGLAHCFAGNVTVAFAFLFFAHVSLRAQQLQWLFGAEAVAPAGTSVAVSLPWGQERLGLVPVRPAGTVLVVVFPGDGSDGSWRSISRSLSLLLAKLPDGEAEVLLLDGVSIRDLGKLSRRTPPQRLIPAEARAIARAAELSVAVEAGSPAANEAASADTSAAGLSASVQAQAIEWLESEPRGWGLAIWLLPDSTPEAEAPDYLRARLLRGASLSQTRLRIESAGSAASNVSNGLLAGLPENELLGPIRFDRDLPPAGAPEMRVAQIPKAPFPQGFHLHPIALALDGLPESAGASLVFPWLTVAEATPVPDASHFDRVRFLERQLRANAPRWTASLRAMPAPDGTALRSTISEEANSAVESILALNPASLDAIQTGMEIAAALGHLATAAHFQARMIAFYPSDPARFAEAGLAAYGALQLALARPLLERAVAMNSQDAAVWHALAVISTIDSRPADALEQSGRAIAFGANNPSLYLLRADLFAQRNDEANRAEALLAARASGEIPLERRLETAAVLLGLQRYDASANALPLPVESLPVAPEILERFALLAERVDSAKRGRPIAQPADSIELETGRAGTPLADASLAAWQRLLAVKVEPSDADRNAGFPPWESPPTDEERIRAVEAVARLHYAAGRDAEAIVAAREAMHAAPVNSALVVLVDALRQQGRAFEARRELYRFGHLTYDLPVLERLAFLEDESGGGASAAYRRLLESKLGSTGQEARWREAGLRCARRDGDLAGIAWFQTDQPGGAAPSDADAKSQTNTLLVRGGTKAVLALAGGEASADTASFLVALSSQIRSRTLRVATEHRKAYYEILRESFRSLDRVLAMGTPSSDHILLHLQTATREETRISARWLKELAVELRWSSGRAVVERNAEGSGAQGQLLALALGVDLLQIEEAVKEKRSLTIRIPIDTVPIILSEADWRAAWGAGEIAGGFGGFLLENPDAATLYLALSQMEKDARETLLQSIGLRRLGERYSELLLAHGPALQVDGGIVAVPGGASAALHWRSLMKADPAQAAAFLESLLRRDDGDALIFYSRMASVDLVRQRFFTESARRLEQFYRTFRETPSLRSQQASEIDQPMPMDFFRELPLDENGKIIFPGSAELWMVARGNAQTARDIAKRAKRLRKAVSPEQEDEILLRLLKTDYERLSHRHGLYESFLAVARIDARRREAARADPRVEPLDEDAAFLLAELSGSMQPLYGYLAELPFLTAEDLRRILGIASRFTDGSPEDRNAEAGQFHGILFASALASYHRTIPPDLLASMLRRFLEAFPEDREPASAARATLGALKELAVAEGSAEDPGLRLFAKFAPWIESPGALPADLHAALEDQWKERYGLLIEAQRLPSLGALLRAGDALELLQKAQGSPQDAMNAFSAAIQDLPDTPEPPKGTVSERAKNLGRYRLVPLREAQGKLVAEVRRASEPKPKPIRPERISRFTSEALEALSPQLTLALSGLLYARFFHPDELLISDDPLFVRRHEYIALREIRKAGVRRTMLEKTGGPDGTFVVGGFEGLARLAGVAAAESSSENRANTEQLLMTELAAIRSTNWMHLDEAATQRFAVQLHAARDWVVLSAGNPAQRTSLEVATYGRVANARRSELFLALDGGDWSLVWRSLSATDLLRLANAIPKSDAAPSPAIRRWLRDGPDSGFLSAVSAPLDLLQNRILPAFAEVPPYEDSAARPYPALAVSRLAESKVYFAEQLARKALPAAGMFRFAESAIRTLLSRATVTGPLDWRAALDCYRTIDLDLLLESPDSLPDVRDPAQQSRIGPSALGASPGGQADAPR